MRLGAGRRSVRWVPASPDGKCGLYSMWDGKLLEGFKQGRDRI